MSLRRTHLKTTLLFLIIYLFLSYDKSYAAKISEISAIDFFEHFRRFIFLQDDATKITVAGIILIGINTGLLGSYLVVTRTALLGDTLSHAVLPGVAAGFLWNFEKNPVAIFIGAVAFGLAGTYLVNLIIKTTKLKTDTALGMVLASFFALGILLFDRINALPGDKSGLNQIFFGQAASLGEKDLILMAVISVISVIVCGLFYHPFLVLSFDKNFAKSIKLPTAIFHNLLMFLLSMTTVLALQAVGVVLVSAMLIIPAATAFLLAKRFHNMIFISIGVACVAGLLGAFFSMLFPGIPTGPGMVIASSLIFFLVLVFAPRNGILIRTINLLKFRNKINREHALKIIYKIMENDNFQSSNILLKDIARAKRFTIEEARKSAKLLTKNNYAKLEQSGLGSDDEVVSITELGIVEAGNIVRKHRLWELYLANQANVETDHVHFDAERIEHILSENTLRKLEQELNHPKRDPHGSKIPR